MTTDDHILGQEVVPAMVVLLVKVSLLEPMNTDLGKWYAANEFFSVSIREENQAQFTFVQNGQ